MHVLAAWTPEQAEGLQRALAEAEQVQSKVSALAGCPTRRLAAVDAWHAGVAHILSAPVHQDQVARKVPLTEDMLEESVDGIRTAVRRSFPGGLPEHDPVQHALDNTEDLTGSKVGLLMLSLEQ